MENQMQTEACSADAVKIIKKERPIGSQPVDSELSLLKEVLHYHNNMESEARRSPLQHSQSTDLTNLFPKTNESCELQQLKQQIIYLQHQNQMYKRENDKLVEASREQLANTRKAKAHDEQLSAMREQLTIKDELIADLKEDMLQSQAKYLNLTEAHQRLAQRVNDEMAEASERIRKSEKKAEQFEISLYQCKEENAKLQADNRLLSAKLFTASAEADALQQGAESSEFMRKERFKNQQKMLAMAEKLDLRKEQLDALNKSLKEKESLVQVQKGQIKELNSALTSLKSLHEHSSVDLERLRGRYEEMERRLEEKETQVEDLREGSIQSRLSERMLEQQTLDTLLSINSLYEAELLELRAELSRREYEEQAKIKIES